MKSHYWTILDSLSSIEDLMKYIPTPILQEEASLIPKKAKDGKRIKCVHKKYYHK